MSRCACGKGIILALLAVAGTTASGQVIVPHQDFSAGVAKIRFVEDWSITSTVLHPELDIGGNAAVWIGWRGYQIIPFGVDIDVPFGTEEDEETKLFAPNPCDEVEVVRAQTLSGESPWYGSCDGSSDTPPNHCDAWAMTQLCAYSTYWQLTGESVANALFWAGQDTGWQVWVDESDECNFQSCEEPDGSCGSAMMTMPAQAEASGLIVFPSGQGIGVIGAMSVYSTVYLAREVWCGLGIGCNGAPLSPSVLAVGMVTFAVEAVNSDSSTETDYEQGVIVWYDDGTSVRLGLLADAAFTPVDDGNGNMSIDVTDFSVPLSISSTDVVNLSVSTSSDTIGVPDGDLDGDGGVCWSDRGEMLGVFGSSLGDGTYTIRGDFDLDGDVDAADTASFNAIGCSADVNCDGVVNSQDQLAFLNLWNASDPSADINMDGSVNSQDFIAYLNIWSIGC